MSALPPKADIDHHGRDGRRKFRPFNNLAVKRPQTPPPQINDLAAFRKMISRATLPQIGAGYARVVSPLEPVDHARWRRAVRKFLLTSSTRSPVNEICISPVMPPI